MKWIEISKAKPKFKQDYLIATTIDGKNVPVIAYLHQSINTAEGVKYEFTDGISGVYEATHIAAITLPGKEVENE